MSDPLAEPSGSIITYTYDKDNELTGVTDAFATLTFTYDSGGRETAAVTSSPGGQPLVTLTYGYDQLNERISLTDSLSGSGGAGQWWTRSWRGSIRAAIQPGT